ncbi:MAG: lipid-A-disaccharide synthase, partial [Prevotellaceae bacterium]|nr:lipid-A-disaccharide synthase [Prevotellaceae bacterium]
HTHIPVYYYIAPKIWAWKEYRIKRVKRDVDEIFSILPFEKSFFEEKHHYPIHYVGNPTADEVAAYQATDHDTFETFAGEHFLSAGKPVIALLAGSRKQEIKNNLPAMLEAADAFPSYQPVLACAPGISPDFYWGYLGNSDVKLLLNHTYALLRHAKIALVTSGTATLETALFRVPQVVCYRMPMGKLMAFLKRHVLKVRFISLVNLIAGREVVKELVADAMTVPQLCAEMERILCDEAYRQQIDDGYGEVLARLGGAKDAPRRAACKMVELLRKRTAK